VRTIKTMGFAIAVALALTAFVGATSASASEFQTPGVGQAVKTNWNGSPVGIKSHTLKLGNDWFSCSNSSFSGEMEGPAAKEITVAPTLSGCVVNSWPASWTMNGCKFRLHPGTGTENQTVGTLDIVGCEKPMTASNESCKFEIGNQSGIGTVEYKNVLLSPSTITAVANLNSITYSRVNFNGCLNTGTFNNGTYSGEWTIKGSVPGSGLPREIKVFGTASPPPPTKFAAEEAPVTIAGVDNVSRKRMYLGGAGSLVCEGYSLNGASASASSASITLVPTYSKCTFNTVSIPDSSVSAGGCSYVLYPNGKLDIAGATCASNPITVSRPGCVITIGPQTGLTGFSYVNEGSGKLRTVSMSGVASSVMKFTAVGANCNGEGVFTNSNLFSTSKLSATNSSGGVQGLSVE
jgi:hypothetical protein